jgi:uncharacterized membrane protein
MKVFIVFRTDEWDYDEYDAFVVVAENGERALEIAKERVNYGQWDVQEADLSSEGILLDSFNAG